MHVDRTASMNDAKRTVSRRRRPIVRALSAILATGILGASGSVALADDPSGSMRLTTGSAQAVAPNPWMDAIVIRGCGDRGWSRGADGHIYCK